MLARQRASGHVTARRVRARTARLTSGIGLAAIAALACVAIPVVRGQAAESEWSLAARAARFPKVRSASAAFTQEREVSLVDEVLRASGMLALKAPDAMHLELTSPEPLTLIATGSAVAVLDAGGKPVPVPAELSGLPRFARDLTDLLLGGRIAGRFAERWDSPDAVVLTPREEGGPFVEVALRFPAGRALPEEIVLRERGGDRTTIRLHDVETNGRIRPELFRLPRATP
jgi:outer membrane lipoprotein-sorting protein